MKKILKFILLFFALAFFSFWCYLNQNYQVPILMYHSLDGNKVGKYAAVEPDVFKQQMKFMHDRGYNVISLSNYVRAIKEKKEIPRNSVVITFDDGYKDTRIAFSLFKKYGFPATFFLIAERIGQEGYLTETDIKLFLDTTSGSLGSHTLTHAYLPGVTGQPLKKELIESKQLLEELFSTEVKALCYPVGGFNYEVLQEVENAGYESACTTNRGFSKEFNLFALRRIKITNRDGSFRLWAKLSGFYNIFKKPKYPY